MEQTEKLPELLEGLAGIGVSSATVLDSIGMGRVQLERGSDASTSAIINEVLTDGSPTNKTIFAVIEDEEKLQQAVALIRSLCGDLSEPGKGILVTLKLNSVEGLKIHHQ